MDICSLLLTGFLSFANQNPEAQLFQAVRNGNPAEVYQALQKVAPDVTDSDDRNALHVAVEAKELNSSVVAVLLAAGCSEKHKNDYCFTPMDSLTARDNVAGLKVWNTVLASSGKTPVINMRHVKEGGCIEKYLQRLSKNTSFSGVKKRNPNKKPVIKIVKRTNDVDALHRYRPRKRITRKKVRRPLKSLNQ